MRLQSLSNNSLLNQVSSQYLLLFLWLILTLINLNKAFHMDDAFHLEAAAHLREHPLTPMSGLINWSYNPEPMSRFNQPPLYFYLLAFVTSLVGNGEVALHLFQSIFTFFALYFFAKIIDLSEIKGKNILMVFFAFCPAFIVNQNLMTDVPILSLVLGMCYFILLAKRDQPFKNYLFASLLLAGGVLIKYSLLPVVVVLLFSILINKSYKSIVLVAIPFVLLGLWSCWNLVEYGGIHILDRPSTENSYYNAFIAIISCLGAITPFAILLLRHIFRFNKKVSNYVVYGALAYCTMAPVCIYYLDLQVGSLLSYTYFFMLFGLITVLVLMLDVFKQLVQTTLTYLQSDSLVFTLFFCGFGLFFFLFAPFIATRHILLMVPFAMLLLAPYLTAAPTKLLGVVVTFSVLYGLIMGISDWKYADYYREMASRVSVPKTKKVWTSGHWGWQYYSQANGMVQFSTDSLEVQHDDYFVYPGNVAIQVNRGEFGLIIEDKLYEDPDWTTFFYGADFAGMYNTYPERPPWIFSKNPIDTIYVCKVDKGVGFLINKIKSDENWFNQVKQKAIDNNVPLDTMLLRDAQWVLDHQ